MTKNPTPHMLANKDKVLYIYLRVTQTMAMMPMFFTSLRAMQDLTWHGMLVLELSHKVTTLIQMQEEVNARQGVNSYTQKWQV